MASQSKDQQWNAVKVRSTFIDYFVKKRGHTFGMSTLGGLCFAATRSC
jgi:hypothetical protein